MAYGLPASKWSLYFSLFHEQNDIIAQQINVNSVPKSCLSGDWGRQFETCARDKMRERNGK